MCVAAKRRCMCARTASLARDRVPHRTALQTRRVASTRTARTLKRVRRRRVQGAPVLMTLGQLLKRRGTRLRSGGERNSGSARSPVTSSNLPQWCRYPVCLTLSCLESTVVVSHGAATHTARKLQVVSICSLLCVCEGLVRHQDPGCGKVREGSKHGREWRKLVRWGAESRPALRGESSRADTCDARVCGVCLCD